MLMIYIAERRHGSAAHCLNVHAHNLNKLRIHSLFLKTYK